MKKLNFIFTGPYLKFWYIAFVLVLSLMLLNHKRLSSVQTFTYTVYDSAGNILSQRDVDRAEANMIKVSNSPVSKAFTPHK